MHLGTVRRVPSREGETGVQTGELEKRERVGPGRVRALKGKASEIEEASLDRREREHTS